MGTECIGKYCIRVCNGEVSTCAKKSVCSPPCSTVDYSSHVRHLPTSVYDACRVNPVHAAAVFYPMHRLYKTTSVCVVCAQQERILFMRLATFCFCCYRAAVDAQLCLSAFNAIPHSAGAATQSPTSTNTGHLPSAPWTAAEEAAFNIAAVTTPCPSTSPRESRATFQAKQRIWAASLTTRATGP